MMFLLLLIPLALLGVVLAGLSWRARQRRTALVMAGISLVCTVLSAGILLAGLLLYQALPVQITG
jgi:hypothetical protein